MIPILLVEDEPAIADTIRFMLDSQGFKTHWHATAQSALAAWDNSIQLCILDVGLPDMSGFDLFRELQKKSAVPVIFLTARSDEIDRIIGLELGADDYMAKPFSPRELVARVRTVLRRVQRPPEPESQAVFIVDEEKRRIQYSGKVLDLTRYEYGVLRLLIKYPGRVFTREELLQKVWENPDDSYDRTVDAHIKIIRQKLKNISPQQEMINTHRGIGYSLAEQ